MTSAEITPASRLRLLDPHVGVTKGQTLNIPVIHDIYDRLFPAVASLAFSNAARLVKRNFATFVFSHELSEPQKLPFCLHLYGLCNLWMGSS
jgi:hypothetical protein